jgi:hypothetical protein
MARLAMGGAELLQASGGQVAGGNQLDGICLGSNGVAAISTSVFRSGAASWSCLSNSLNTSTPLVTHRGASLALVANTSYFFRVYMRFDNLPTSTVYVAADTATPTAVGIKLTTTGTFQLWNPQSNTQIGSDSGAITAGDGVWHRLEFKVVTGASSVTGTEAYVDGVLIATSGTLSAPALGNTVSIAAGWLSAPGASLQCYIDDIAINDSTGSQQTGYPGDGSLVLLVPTSDNAKGTGWTNDAATTTNLWDAVNNLPPVGIADTVTGSGLHQLRNATSNANTNYDANMMSYAAAGIGPNDTVNVVIPICATAAPVTTSSKQGTVGVVSNPAIANIALDAAGTSGAFWEGTAAGTFGAGWKGSIGTITHAPSVTIGTAPVMRITQVTSSTRIAMVCLMGMYVDFTPGRAPIIETGLRTPNFVRQAVNRAGTY